VKSRNRLVARIALNSTLYASSFLLVYVLLNVSLMMKNLKLSFKIYVHVSILGKWDAEIYCGYGYVIDDFCKQ